jgi:hypothetical protein
MFDRKSINLNALGNLCAKTVCYLWDFRTSIVVLTNLSFQHTNKIKIGLTVSNFFYYCSQSFCICGFKQLYTSNHSELDTCSYEIFLTTCMHHMGLYSGVNQYMVSI